MRIRSIAAASLSALIIIAAVSLSGCGGGAGPAGNALSSIAPADGATGVPVTQVITATFSKDLDETTLTATNITLTRAAGTLNVPGAIAYDAASRTLTFTPDVPLFGGMLYTFTITAGAKTKAAGDRAITFTTQEAPLLFMSADNATAGPIDLWSMNADGSSKTNLTNFGTKAAGSILFQAAWSPDLTRVAFIATTNDPEDRANLYVMNADGSNLINLTNGGVNYEVRMIKWSPDGSKIYFMFTPDNSGADDHVDVGSVNPDGTGLANVTNLASTLTVQTPVWLISPDGTRLYYCAAGFAADDPYDIYSVGSDGTGTTKLTDMPAGGKAVYQRLSPDGAILYFTAGNLTTGYGLYSMNVDGSGQQTLVEPVVGRVIMTWDVSPDGSRLISSFVTGGLNDVYIVNTDGSGTTQLTTASGSMQALVGNWSPDGTIVAYLFGDTSSGPLDLFVANRDGTGAANLTNYTAGTYAFDGSLYYFGLNAGRFSPDGTQIVFNQEVEVGADTQYNALIANVDGSGITALTSSTPPQVSAFVSWW